MHRARPAFLRLPVRLSWLVWLALLLPAAQSAAAWHALSHLNRSAVAQDEHQGAPGPSHCDLCLAASALGHGGLPAQVAALLLPALPALLPLATPAGLWLGGLVLAYRSRGPPLQTR